MGTPKFFEGGSTANYMIGGTRFWFDRLVDDTVSPNLFRGYRDFGNIKQAPDTPEREVKDHFTTRLGGRRKDRTLTQELGSDVVITFDELSAENLWNYLKGAALTEVAAGTNSVTDYVGQVDGTAGSAQADLIILPDFNPSSIVVKDITAGTTYVVNTHYTIENVVGGYKAVRVIIGAGGAPVIGDYLRINYTGTVRKHKLIKPGTQAQIFGKAIFFGVSDTGPEYIRTYRNVQIESEGGMDVKPDDWSDWQVHIKVLDDSEVTPTAPWGLFEYYGVGSNVYNGS